MSIARMYCMSIARIHCIAVVGRDCVVVVIIDNRSRCWRVAVGLLRGVITTITAEWIHLAMDVLAELKDNMNSDLSSIGYIEKG